MAITPVIYIYSLVLTAAGHQVLVTVPHILEMLLLSAEFQDAKNAPPARRHGFREVFLTTKMGFEKQELQLWPFISYKYWTNPIYRMYKHIEKKNSYNW